jgi:hypothetical protein
MLTPDRQILLRYISSGFFSIFLIIIIFAIKLSSPAFLSSADPYYHIKHANTYWTGEKMGLPVFSTINKDGADLYPLYHLALAPFTAFFKGDNYEVLIIGSKIFHSIIAALFLAVFFEVARRVLRQGRHKYSESRTVFWAVVGTFFLFVAPFTFAFRLFLPRPHLFAMLAVFLSFYFLLRKRYLPLFLLAAAFPLFYSVSFLILIPVFIYIFCDLLYNRACLKKLKSYLPLAPVLGGLSLGVWLHPQPLHYLYNGYLIHILALFHRFKLNVIEGAELYAYDLTPRDWIWFVPLIMVMVFFITRLIGWRNMRRALTFGQFYLLTLAFSFMWVFIVVERATEYFMPLAVLAMLWVAVDHAYPSFKRAVESPKQTAAAGKPDAGVGGSTRRKAEELLRGFMSALWERRLFFRSFFLAVLGAYFLGTLISLAYQMSLGASDLEKYSAAARFMREHSQEGDIVFHPQFENYPRLVFLNNKNRYIAGMGSTFTYQYDPAKYWLWRHIVEGEDIICP